MKKFIITLSLFASVCMYAQQVTHTVAPKETVYGISKQYQVTQEALIEANPFLQERGLQIGDVLTIPVPEVTTPTLPEVEKENFEDKDFIYHVAQPKEGVYRLSVNYEVPQEVILSLNTFIDERGLQVGDIVRIPKVDNSTGKKEPKLPEGMHRVQAGETVWRIAENYNLDVADIYAANRSLETEGLKAGSYINIPKKKSVTIEDKFFQHKVEKEETIFSIMNKYEVSLDELIANNPALENGLKAGTTLRVPLKQNAVIETEPQVLVNNATASEDREINLVWMMPFFLDRPERFSAERKVAQDFYMGAQLALHDLLKQGKKIKVHVMDTQYDAASVDEFLNSYDMQKVDAVVGPFFKSMVLHVANKLDGSGVPIVSPLTNATELDQFENMYISTPREEFVAATLVEELAKSYNGEPIKMLTTTNENEIAQFTKNLILQKFPNANVTITTKIEDMVQPVKKEQVENEDGTTTEQETALPMVAFLASENNALGRQFMKKLYEMDEATIDAYSLYYTPSFDIFNGSNKNNVEKLKKVGFVYTTTRLVNVYGQNEKRIIKSFEDMYCEKPNKYMALGYDVVYDLVDRMDENGVISPQALKESHTRLSSKISYTTAEGQKSKVNTDIRIIRLGK